MRNFTGPESSWFTVSSMEDGMSSKPEWYLGQTNIMEERIFTPTSIDRCKWVDPFEIRFLAWGLAWDLETCRVVSLHDESLPWRQVDISGRCGIGDSAFKSWCWYLSSKPRTVCVPLYKTNVKYHYCFCSAKLGKDQWGCYFRLGLTHLSAIRASIGSAIE